MDINEIKADREKYLKELQTAVLVQRRLEGVIAYLDSKIKESEEASKEVK